MSNIVVGRVHHGGKTYEATRIYYPQHPSNAVEFDVAGVEGRHLAFGEVLVEHFTADDGPNPSVWTSKVYFLFWLGWLVVLLVGVGYVGR